MHRRAFLALAPALAVGGCMSRHDPAQDATPVTGVTADFLQAAHEQTKHMVWYDAKYSKIPYPNGDVAPDHGVCADVVIRAYRSIGIDLQKLVHEDMVANFKLYPTRWGLKAPDPNIDHRRVPNLMVFFSRFGKSLPFTQNPGDYQPGDIITNRPGGGTHIAIVSDGKAFSGRHKVIQNIGTGTHEYDQLLSYPLMGHYRYAL